MKREKREKCVGKAERWRGVRRGGAMRVQREEQCCQCSKELTAA